MSTTTEDPTKKGLQFPAEKGRFVRKDSSFRNWIKADGSTPFTPEYDRYHLYVSLACPWANRTLITRNLKGLQDIFPVTVVHWFMGKDSWTFVSEDDEKPFPPLCTPEPNYGFSKLSEIYRKADADYDGRFTVPVLWDKKLETIVNNESSEIIQMMNSEFESLIPSKVDLYPVERREEIKSVAESFYNSLNNGVYRCGFAKSQEAYDEAIEELTNCLDSLEEKLSKNRYIVEGTNSITLADIRLFVTLIRFDPVYITHFKTNTRRISDYPALSGYMREIYQMPKVKETINFEHIKKHYFGSHFFINPYGIVPAGPDMSYLDIPHGRDNV